MKLLPKNLFTLFFHLHFHIMFLHCNLYLHLYLHHPNHPFIKLIQAFLVPGFRPPDFRQPLSPKLVRQHRPDDRQQLAQFFFFEGRIGGRFVFLQICDVKLAGKMWTPSVKQNRCRKFLGLMIQFKGLFFHSWWYVYHLLLLLPLLLLLLVVVVVVVFGSSNNSTPTKKKAQKNQRNIAPQALEACEVLGGASAFIVCFFSLLEVDANAKDPRN